MSFNILFTLVLLFAVIRLSQRVGDLENRIKNLSSPASLQTNNAPKMGDQGFLIKPESSFAAPTPAPTPLPASSHDWSDQLTDWVKEDFLMKIGGLLIFLGFAWFVSFAFINNWIGPMGRIALGLIAGASILGFGFYRIRRFTNQGSVFVVLGAGTILLTVFSARVLYDMFTPTSALVIMFLTSAVVALIAVRFRVQMLAFIGLILAGVVPLLIHSGSTNYIGLFSYLAVVVVGVLWVVFLTEWRDLLVASLALLSLYSYGYWNGYQQNDTDILLLFSYAFTVVFFAANIAGFLRAKEASQANIVGVVWNGLFLLFWILEGVTKEWQSLVLSFWTVALLFSAFLLFHLTKNAKPFLSNAVVGIVFLGVATGVELDGAVLGIAYTLEAGAIVLLTHLFLRNRKITEITSFLFLIPGIFALGSVASYPGYYAQSNTLFGEHFFLILLFSSVLLVLGAFIRKFYPSVEPVNTESVLLPSAMTIIGAVFLLVLLWLFLHHAFPQETAAFIALGIYTLLGITLYLTGRESSSRSMRIAGGTLIGFVVFHLFLVDVWQMELFFRIITFFVVGALLMGTAFINRGRKII